MDSARAPRELSGLAALDYEPGETRDVFCDFYGECLKVALKSGWEDWTCRYCRRRGMNQMSATDFAQDRRD